MMNYKAEQVFQYYKNMYNSGGSFRVYDDLNDDYEDGKITYDEMLQVRYALRQYEESY